MKKIWRKPWFWACFAVFSIWMIYTNITVGVTTYSIAYSHLPAAFEGYRIVQISDLHNAVYGRENEALLGKVEEAQPDMIAITGDFVDSGNTNVEVALALAEKLTKLAPCYYVTGNHEAWVSRDTYSALENGLLELGVVVLRDKEIRVERNGEYLSLTGVDDPDIGSRYQGVSADMGAGAIEKLAEQEDFRILLSHRPEYYEVYLQSNANLILTGHAHGGQFRLPVIGGLVAPNQGLFPEYDSGVYQEGDCAMVVSRGIGNSVIPVRFGNQPELVVVELQGKGF